MGGIEHAALYLLGYARFYFKLMRDEGAVGDELKRPMMLGMVLQGARRRPNQPAMPVIRKSYWIDTASDAVRVAMMSPRRLSSLLSGAHGPGRCNAFS